MNLSLSSSGAPDAAMSNDASALRIAVFASAFHPSLGGVEELVRQLAHAYRARGAHVVIVTNRWPRDLPAFEEYEGLPVYRLALRVPGRSLQSRASFALTHRAVERQTTRLLRAHRINLLHVQCLGCNAFYAWRAKIALQLPLVVTAQGELTMDAMGIFQRDSFSNRMLPRIVGAADYVTGCSRKTLDDLKTHLGDALEGRSRSIPNGASLGEFGRAQPWAHPRPYVLGIGRLAPQKGFDVLLRAFALTLQREEARDYDLLLAGDGPERARLETLARELDLGERVRFLGRADRAQTAALFRGCALLALPSRADEGLPLVAIEGMAAGKAVIATPTGGLLEALTDGESGLIVPKEDVAALSRALSRLIADPSERERLGRAAQSRARDFDWSALADRYLRLFHEVLSPSLPAAPRSSGAS